MYDKAGVVLRVETVINNPEDFRVRRTMRRKGEPKTLWVPMRKGVAYLFRYRDVFCSANGRYLDALAVVDDPTAKVKEPDQVTRRNRDSSGRTARALNPPSRDDVQIFQAVCLLSLLEFLHKRGGSTDEGSTNEGSTDEGSILGGRYFGRSLRPSA